MAIPKKGSRILTVSDVRYRWLVSIRDNVVNLVIELADEPGQRLHAYFQCRDLHVRGDDGEWRFHSQKQSITPVHVRRIVTHALNHGWQPGARGAKPFVLEHSAKVALTIDADLIDSRFIDHDAKVAHIKEIARDFLWTYMCLSLCLDGEMHHRIMDAEPSTAIPINDENMQRMGLSFCAFKDSPTPDGRPVVALQCNEFPDITEHYWWVYFG